MAIAADKVGTVLALARASDAEAAKGRLRATCEKRGITEAEDFQAWFSKVPSPAFSGGWQM